MACAAVKMAGKQDIGRAQRVTIVTVVRSQTALGGGPYTRLPTARRA